MTLIKNSLLILFLGSLLSGCTARIGDLSLVSTKNIDLSKSKLDMSTGVNVFGEDCKHSLVGLPNLEAAIDDALQKGTGNVLVDEVTEFKSIWVLIGSIQCYKVKGTAYKLGVVAGG